MPSKSKAQFKFFKMLEHNPDLAKEKGISTEKAKEMTKDNVGKKSFTKLKDKITKKKD